MPRTLTAYCTAIEAPYRVGGRVTPEALARLYAAGRLHANLLQPSFKLRQKTATARVVIKRYHAPEPPVARPLAHPALDDATKDRLRALRQRCDPVRQYSFPSVYRVAK